MIKIHKYFPFKLMSLVLLIPLTSCAPVISKQIRDQVKPDITFAAVLQNPEQYQGHMVIFSGVIIEATNTKEGTVIKVLQRPDGFRGQPKDTDESEGRFLARDSRYLDVDVYAKGRSVTIAGEVQGKQVLPLGGIEYTYPLIQIKEIYLWPEVKRYYERYPYWYYNDYWWWRSGFLYY